VRHQDKTFSSVEVLYKQFFKNYRTCSPASWWWHSNHNVPKPEPWFWGHW